MTDRTDHVLRSRDIVRSVLRAPHVDIDLDSDVEFRSYLEGMYDESKRQLAKAMTIGAPSAQISANKAGLFVYAVGLLTFGRLEVADDVITGPPPGPGTVTRLVSTANAALPLPEGLDAVTDPAGALEWLQTNRGKLAWNEEQKRFVLAT